MPISDYTSYEDISTVSKSDSPSIDKAVLIRLEDGDKEEGDGVVTIPFDSVSSVEDIAFYDEDENLLDYDVVNPEDIDGSDTSTGIDCYVYRTWTFDGSVHAKVAYGDNSANEDRSDSVATWSHSSQNCEVALYAQDTDGTDAAGNHDFSVTSGVGTASDSDYVGDVMWDFPGVEDEEAVASDDWKGISGDNPRTVVIHVKGSTNDDDSYVKWGRGDISEKYSIRLATGKPRVEVTGGYYVADAQVDDGDFHVVSVVFPDSGTDITDHDWFVDGSDPGEDSSASEDVDTAEDEPVTIGGQHFGEHDPLTQDISVRIYSDGKGSVWNNVEWEQTSSGGFTALKQEGVQPPISLSVSDKLGAEGFISRDAFFYRTYSEELEIETSTSKFIRFYVDNVLGLSDAYSTVKEFFRTYVEGIGFKSNVSSAVDYLISAVSSLGVKETFSIGKRYELFLQDTIGVSHKLAVIKKYLRVLVEKASSVLSASETDDSSFTAEESDKSENTVVENDTNRN